jgi:hypothetical protein
MNFIAHDGKELKILTDAKINHGRACCRDIIIKRLFIR